MVSLTSGDEFARTHALESLKDIDLPDTDQRVVTALRDSSFLVRKAAAFAAGEMRVRDALPHLAPLLINVSSANAADATNGEQVRLAAIFALHRLGDFSHTHDLEQTAIDPRPPVRGDTAFVLGMLGEPTAIPILEEMLRHDADGNVRLQAAEALWRLGSEKGEDALVAATISAYASDQAIALLGLAQPRDARILGNIEGFLTADYPEVALIAARAAGMLGSDQGYGVARIGAESRDPRQRALAALAFGAIGRTDAQPMLARLLRDDQPDVRLAAADAVGMVDKAADHMSR